MKKLMTFMLTLLMCIGMIMVFSPQTVRAAKQEGDIAGGVYDEVDWRITAEGELIIGDGTEQTFTYRENRYEGAFPWYRYSNQIESVRFDGVVHGNGSMGFMFYKLENAVDIDLKGFETSNVTSLSNMFCWCTNLTSLDVSGFNTSKVNRMDFMFCQCSGLTSLDVSNFDTRNVTSMSNMFSSCKSLSTIDLSNFDTRNVTNMNGMFSTCSSLTSLDVSNFDTSKVTDMWGLFDGCSKLESLDLSSWNTRRVEEMHYVFNDCSKLKSLNISGWDTRNVKSMCGMFHGCESLETLDLSSFNTANVEDMGFMFIDCKSLKMLDLSMFNTDNTTSFNSMFTGCSGLEYLDISSFNTHKVRDMQIMFDRCNSLKSIVLGNDFSFKGDGSISGSYLPSVPVPSSDSPYTGKWISADGVNGPFTSEQLRDSYNGRTMAGLWVWEGLASCEIRFEAPDNASGSMTLLHFLSDLDFKIPTCQYAIFDHTFLYWDDGQGHQYENKATIPAGTYAPGSTVTLTAVFEANSHNVSMEDGAFEFSIKAGEKATFDNIPAGTTYQIYEKTEDGWVLVQQENASGVIEALEESAASFWNKYQPGVVTVQFTGTKKLDGHPAKEGAYQFELLDEHRNVIQTKTLFDGGFIQFDPIEYTKDDLGEHTYIIREIDPQDDSIDYDTHEETVNVLVKENVISEGLTVHSYSDNLNESGEKESDYISNKNYTDVITIPDAEKLHVTVKYTNPRGHFWIWQGAHANVHSQNWNATCNPDTALKNYIYQSGKDQEYLKDEFDVIGDSISVLYSSYAYPSSYGYYPNGPYSDMVNYGYYITVSSDTTELAADVTYDEDGVAFNNTTRPGVLKITKDGSELTEANKDDTFTFEIEFANENGMPISDEIYWYVEN